MKLYFLLALLLLPVAGAFQYSEELVIDSMISNRVEFVVTSSNPSLSYLRLYHSWIPLDDYRQEVISISTNPSSELGDGVAVFEITDLRDLTVSLNFRTKTGAERVKVNQKVGFPLSSLSPGLVKYTEPAGLIDVNPEIRSVASSIVGDTDDLYEAVFRLAVWVNENVEYSLSTLSEEATKSSSWVLEERRGVCVELTNLFISMARSLGIPAKFVSGIAYTDSELFDFNWGGHGWAEVYFPGYGWVPVDPTYSQIGFVDASHIKLEEGVEGSKYNTRYEWRGRGFDVVPGLMNIHSNVVTEGRMIREGVSASLSFLADEVSLDSYNVIIGTLKNNNDFYVAKEFLLSRTENLELLSAPEKNVLLRPGEQKEVYWVVRLKGLRQGFIYTFPVMLYDALNLRVEKSFRASSRGSIIGESTTQFFLEDAPGNDLELYCEQVERAVYAGNPVSVECSVSSPVSEPVEVCLGSFVCKEIFLDNEEIVILSLDSAPIGYNVFVVEARSSSGTSRSFVDFNVLDAASIDVGVSASSPLSFKDSGFVEFRAERNSLAVPRNLSVTISHPFFGEEFSVERLDDYQDFRFVFRARDLKPNENVFIISFVYLDELGKSYSVEEKVVVMVEGLSFFERVRLWLNHVNAWF